MTNDLERVGPLASYAEFLQDLNAKVRQAQIRTTLAFNRELVLLYWGIGRETLHKQQEIG